MQVRALNRISADLLVPGTVLWDGPGGAVQQLQQFKVPLGCSRTVLAVSSSSIVIPVFGRPLPQVVS